MITCQKCGKENQDHYKFCLGCGAELTRDVAAKPGGRGPVVAAEVTAGAERGYERALEAPVVEPPAAPVLTADSTHASAKCGSFMLQSNSRTSIPARSLDFSPSKSALSASAS